MTTTKEAKPVTIKETKPVTMQQIWKKLSKINVKEHTGQINGLDYLPWSKALALVMEHFPTMRYTFELWTDTNGNRQLVNQVPAKDGFTGIVACTVEIEGHTRNMVLPIMTGYSNKAVLNPTSRDITDSLMRCLTKCFAMFGLGHHIYAGEGLPKDYSEMQKKVVTHTKGNTTKKIPLVQPLTNEAPTITLETQE